MASARKKATSKNKKPGRGKAREAFLVRLQPAVLEAVKRLAEQDMRSANAQVEVLLREALRCRGIRLKPPGEE